MPDMKLDLTAWPVVSALVDEIGATFRADGLTISRVVPQWAENAIMDIGEDGCVAEQAWVRLVTQSPSMQFPAGQAAPVWGGRTAPGSPVRIATTLEVGAMHCTGWQLSEQFVPSVDEYMADAEQSYAEMSALRRAICKTMVAQKREYQLLSYQPTNDGVSSGGAWQVALDWMKGS